MKPNLTRSTKIANYLIASVLALIPFHAFLTVFASSLVGHYTALRLWDDGALLCLIFIVCSWLLTDRKLCTWFMRSLLVRLIATYALLTVILGIVSLFKGDVSLKALGYGILINLRFLAWFLGVLLTAQRSPWLKQYWTKIIIIPAVIVIVFAVLQYIVLPHNFLVHFGYHTGTTISPTETINNNNHYLRAQSTLRGANPLGAYLVVIFGVLGVAYMRRKYRLIFGISSAVAFFALYASGSRSAWLGTILTLGTISWYHLKNRRTRILFGIAVIVGIGMAASGYLLLKNNTSVQNALLHTQQHSKVSTSSNSAHASATESGIKDVLQQPLGDGPGTAGPASKYNQKQPARIAEDYYVQIAQETGWLGLALFLNILVLIAIELYAQIGTSRLSLALFAGLLGVSFVNLLSHAWTDDTLAFVWWGLAGLALARPFSLSTKQTKETKL